MSDAPAKRTPAWHKQVAEELNRDFVEVQGLTLTAARRRAWLGLKFLWVKSKGKEDGSIPHGAFGPWLRKNCPGIAWTTINDYIAEARSLSERMGWQISEFRNFETAPHLLIEAPKDGLSKGDQKAQQLLFDLIEGKGKFRAVTEYKQVEDGLDLGETRVKHGRLRGQGGVSREVRHSVAEARAAAQREALKIRALEVSEWLMEVADITHLGDMDSPVLEKLTLAMEAALPVCRDIRANRRH